MESSRSGDVPVPTGPAGLPTPSPPPVAAVRFEQVYSDLRRLASAWMSRLPPGQTLQPTALVHEAYLRLSSRGALSWESRAQFFSAAAQAMRDLLVERARHYGRLKCGGGHRPKSLDEDVTARHDGASEQDVLALDDALCRLELQDPRKARIVMLRYFAGLTIEEVAEIVGTATATVKRDWTYAKAWLYDAMESHAGDNDGRN